MRFLKKASYQDIIGDIAGSPFHYYEDITAKYKEFELYLTKTDLEELNDSCKVQKLMNKLKKDGAIISAIHCPESRFETCNDGEHALSSNYLSLCEVINDNDSGELLKKVLKLADKICQKQSENEKTSNYEYDDKVNIGNIDASDTTEKTKTRKDSIIVILHEGCEKGCTDCNSTEGKACNVGEEIIAARLNGLIKDLGIKSTIKIALENVTPFYSTTNIEVGKNCGWKYDNQKSNKVFFDKINKELERTNLQFGACIDFCHIMVSSKIMNTGGTKSDALEAYFENIDYINDIDDINNIYDKEYKEYIFLFHVSNCGEDFSHGQLFLLENDEDKAALEKIRTLCNKYAPKAPITFEMTDGEDMEKAALNYEHIMFYFSNKHLFGKFSKLLDVDANKELKEFFDNLFIIYTYDKKSVFEITNALWRVKQIILKNTFDSKNDSKKEERLFGVDFDKTNVNLSLVRLKAYVYYTRFCNLGNYLAENYYSGNKCIWDKKEDAEEDFGLAMKYFIFNDKIHQCVYTGIQYKFLIDFLPKKEKFVRFNDGITRIKEMKAESDNVFLDVVKKIPGHISGAIIQNGKADFYSVGKNFVQCLFKYFDSSHTDWSVRIYSNVPINYVDYNEKRYSIQAFTQMKLSDDNFIVEGNKIDLSLDISRFALGRDGKDTDTLEGFLKYFDSNLDFSKEKVASISDEEILFTKLPDVSEEYEYTLDKIEGVILKKICLRMIGKNVDTIAGKIEFIAGDSQNDSIECDKNKQELNELNKEVKAVNDNINHPIWKIIEYVKDNITKSKKKPQDLEELNVYSGNDKTIYENLKNHVVFKIEGEK